MNTAASGATGVALQLLDSVGGNLVDLAGGGKFAGDIVLANGATSTSYDYAAVRLRSGDRDAWSGTRL